MFESFNVRYGFLTLCLIILLKYNVSIRETDLFEQHRVICLLNAALLGTLQLETFINS